MSETGALGGGHRLEAVREHLALVAGHGLHQRGAGADSGAEFGRQQGGVAERHPSLHFSLIEFNAHWLASLVGAMDKCWVTGIGQDADWWLGIWDDTRPPTDQPNVAQLFRLNDKWPYPLAPSEYVQRQFHVSFQDDPVAVACRHITGL